MLIGGLLLGAVLVGSALGTAVPGLSGPAGSLVSPIIFLLVTMLLTGVRGGAPAALRRAPKVVVVACAFNYLLVPIVAVAVSSVVMVHAEALRVGVMLYCLFPCTDWFLGFTRLAGGDTRVGAGLIPVNMTLQLALFPVYLHLLSGTGTHPLGGSDWMNLVSWFAIPATIAVALRVVAHHTGLTQRLVRGADGAVPAVLTVLVAALFAANVSTVLDHPAAFLRVLVTVFCFLVSTYVLGEIVTRRIGFSYPERALIVMTTSARNAPLILALTIVALPHQPLVYAAIVLGMLVEFPHLTTLQYLLRRSRDRAATATTPPQAKALVR